MSVSRRSDGEEAGWENSFEIGKKSFVEELQIGLIFRCDIDAVLICVRSIFSFFFFFFNLGKHFLQIEQIEE